MRSPAERIRRTAEGVLRGIVIALLAGWLVWSIRARTHGAVEHVTSQELREALERWTTRQQPARVLVDLAHPPAGAERDWLAALSAAGTTVQWSGNALLPTAIDIEPRVDPEGGATVTVAAPESASVVLRDARGVIDSAAADAYGMRASIARPGRTIDAGVGPVVARAALRDSLTLKRLLVIGAPDWETKFTIAALEERGWDVDAHIRIAPRTLARQGRIESIDTARYAAVLAIDTTAARFSSAIKRYVRSGGGLVLWSPAAPAFGRLAPGRAGALIESEVRIIRDRTPPVALDVMPVTALTDDAVALERRGDHVTLAARRVGPGKVLQNAYTNSWRWRMAGGDNAPDEHRAWLADLVANVAYAPRATIAAPPADPVPVAAIVDRLGPAVPAVMDRSALDPTRLAAWVFTILCMALIAELASRRLRGVR